jgi:hypothetical protein
LVAATVNVWAVPGESPVTVIGDEVPVTVTGLPLAGVAVTV